MKRILFILVIALFGLSLVSSHENFTETKQLIDSGIACDQLSNEQLKEIGDYYMEQMHPGQAHELMHQMMGGEDSETTKQMHVNMAKSIYCGENIGMMGMMNMMNGGMMNMAGSMMNYGMMGSYGYWSFLNIIYTLLIIGLVILVYLWIIKLWKSMQNKKKR